MPHTKSTAREAASDPSIATSTRIGLAAAVGVAAVLIGVPPAL
jgi:hypothetical protein